jgi:hypothetical protein
LFLFRKKERVKVTVHQFGVDWYMASAHDGTKGVHNCYGSTREAAEAMARLRLKLFQEDTTPRKITLDLTTQNRRNNCNVDNSDL